MWFVDRIYPIELETKDTSDTDKSTSYLNLHLEIDSEGRLRTNPYDKRDDFNFPIVNFPFICSNIPAAPAYGVYISQLILYSRACGSYQDFFDRGLLLTRKLLNQGFQLVKLKSALSESCLGWSLWNICVTNDHGYVPLVVSTSRSFPHSWLITGFVAILTRRMPLVEHELLTLPENMSSPPVFSWFRVTRSLVLCVYFVDRCLSFRTFLFWSLCYLFFFDIRIMITLLVSANTSYLLWHTKRQYNVQRINQSKFMLF